MIDEATKIAERFVLGVDCSTTACKAIVWSGEGRAVAEGKASIPLSNPAPDAWEQDASLYWSALVGAVTQALAGWDKPASRIEAMCVTHQRETIVFTDDEGSPLAPAIVWMDGRCHDEAAQIARSLGEANVLEISGKVPCTTPSMYKAMRAFSDAPSLAARRPWVLDVHAFLVRRLVGSFVTSLASADPTGLVDLRARDWSTMLLDAAGIARRQLPSLVAPGEPLGQLTSRAAEALGLASGLVVIAGAGDGQAAALGVGLGASQRAYLNLGTAIVSGVHVRSYAVDRAFRTLFAALPDAYLLETDLKGGTFTVSWLVERLLGHSAEGAADAIASLDAQASLVPPGASGLVLLPYWNGVMNPHWDDAATGVVLGLRGEHGRVELFRAILEGIAMEQRLHLEGVSAATGIAIDEVVVTGGGARSALFCRIVADVLGKTVIRCREPEATCLGAGMLAAAASGIYPSVAAASEAMSSLGDRFMPGGLQPFYDELYRDVFQGLYPALSGAMRRLEGLRHRARSLR